VVGVDASHTVTREVSRCSSTDGSECNGPELEVDTMTDREPVQCSCRWSSVALEMNDVMLEKLQG